MIDFDVDLALPRYPTAAADAMSGRGLLIVDRLTTRWGVHGGTTHVWFEMLTYSRGRQGAGPHIGEESRPRQHPY